MSRRTRLEGGKNVDNEDGVGETKGRGGVDAGVGWMLGWGLQTFFSFEWK